MSDELKQFLTEWLEWAGGGGGGGCAGGGEGVSVGGGGGCHIGAPEDPVFFKHYGLCANLERWADRKRLSDLDAAFLRFELADALRWKKYPFDVSGLDHANEEDKTRNPARVAWVRNYLKESQR